MKSLSLILILTLATSCTSNQIKKSDKEGLIHLKLGSSQLRQGLYPQALKSLLTAESIIPKNAVLQNNLGLAYYVREKYNRATFHLQKALDINPKYTEARNNLAHLFIEKRKFDKALIHLKIAKEDLTFTNSEKIYSNLGMVYFYKKQFSTALINFKQSLSIHKKDCKTSVFYGKTLFELKKFKTASVVLSHSIHLCPEEYKPEPKYFAALSYIKTGNNQQATVLLQEVIYTSENAILKNKAEKTLSLLTRVQL